MVEEILDKVLLELAKVEDYELILNQEPRKECVSEFVRVVRGERNDGLLG